jgi:hypothetical protein
LPTESDPKASNSGSVLAPKSFSTEQAPQNSFFAKKKEENKEFSFFGKTEVSAKNLFFNNHNPADEKSNENPSEPTFDSGVFFKNKPLPTSTGFTGNLFSANGLKKIYIPKEEVTEEQSALDATKKE